MKLEWIKENLSAGSDSIPEKYRHANKSVLPFSKFAEKVILFPLAII